MENQNSREYLDKHLYVLSLFSGIYFGSAQLMENLRSTEHAPSVSQFVRPPDHAMEEENEDDRDPDQRKTRKSILSFQQVWKLVTFGRFYDLDKFPI